MIWKYLLTLYSHAFLSADFEFYVRIFTKYFLKSQVKEAGLNIATFQKTKKK